MRRVPRKVLRHRLTVEPYQGSSSVGDVYRPAEIVRCLLDESTQQVTTPGGENVTSSSSYIAWPDHQPPLNSRVTLPDGRKTKVIKVGRVNAVGLPVPNNTQVFLQ
ncbi:hypothetical protein B1H29_31675 [Streptomyces pactum]|uniref:Uncharacterized protein n=1 Tax=Streptomyces pactum TaxID=68249 RepID=A0A1S6JKR6_9ACTN|nr:hypothetical protein B1H29_31675 [Streptomyces pactum]